MRQEHQQHLLLDGVSIFVVDDLVDDILLPAVRAPETKMAVIEYPQVPRESYCEIVRCGAQQV